MKKRALLPAAISLGLIAVTCGSARSVPLVAVSRSVEIRAGAPDSAVGNGTGLRPALSLATNGAVGVQTGPGETHPDVLHHPPHLPAASIPAGTTVRRTPQLTPSAIAIQVALSELGRPYVWGATGPWAFDCSGLVQYSYRHAGIRLPRTTWDQINVGRRVPVADIRPGDLVFYVRGAHVALYVGGGRIVQAPHPGADVELSGLFSMNIFEVVRPD